MNKSRRSRISDIYDQLDAPISSIEVILMEEQSAYDNMPESLQYSERGEKMEAAIEALESARSSIEEAQDYLSEAME